MTTDPQTTNDMRELYAVQHAITDAGGTLTPAVHKAIDALRETWDRELRRAQAEAYQYRTALQGVAHSAAPAPAPAPAVSPELRDQIAEALIAWTYRGKDPEHGGILETVRANAYSRADAVLAVLLGPIPADTNVATWTAVRAIQLMNEAGRQRDAAVSASVDRATVYRELAALAEGDDGYVTQQELRRMAREAERGADPSRMAVEAQQQTETPAVDPAERRDRYAQALAEITVGHRAFIKVDVQAEHVRADAVIAIADAEQAELRRERGLAIAHDRQPYPTAWAYEQACKALHRKTDLLDKIHALGQAWSRPTMTAPTQVAGEHLLRLLAAAPDGADAQPAVVAAVAGEAPDGETPVVCEGFQWIGQSFAICDRCAQPAWEHAGEDVAVEGAGPFDNRRTVRPWGPGEADRIRAKWAPAVVSQPGKEPRP